MRALAIIPARGGSKGILRKNVKCLAGKPLIAYAIEQANLANSVERVVVSTDDTEIAQVAERFGAEVIWRPSAISGDESSSESALLHVLDSLASEGYKPDLTVFLQCTSPLTLAEDIDGTVGALLDEAADSALAVTPFHYFLWKPDGDGINHEKAFRPRRQDRDPQFLETGAVYAMRTDGFQHAKHRFFGKTALYVMPEDRVLEIDEPIHFQVAEAILANRQKHQRKSRLPSKIGALVFDFDGVFTDNRVVVFQDGTEAVLCDRGDGLGLRYLRETGLPLLVLSAEVNPVVEQRCKKLQIPCLFGVHEKLPALREWLSEKGISPADAVYVGNDHNDVECMHSVGCGIAVGDAHPSAIAAANIVLASPGGRGAVRELVDLILQRLEEN